MTGKRVQVVMPDALDHKQFLQLCPGLPVQLFAVVRRNYAIPFAVNEEYRGRDPVNFFDVLVLFFLKNILFKQIL